MIRIPYIMLPLSKASLNFSIIKNTGFLGQYLWEFRLHCQILNALMKHCGSHPGTQSASSEMIFLVPALHLLPIKISEQLHHSSEAIEIPFHLIIVETYGL